MSSFRYGSLFPSILLQIYFLSTYYAECSARGLRGDIKPSLGLGEVGSQAEETRQVRIKNQTWAWGSVEPSARVTGNQGWERVTRPG